MTPPKIDFLTLVAWGKSPITMDNFHQMADQMLELKDLFKRVLLVSSGLAIGNAWSLLNSQSQSLAMASLVIDRCKECGWRDCDRQSLEHTKEDIKISASLIAKCREVYADSKYQELKSQVDNLRKEGKIKAEIKAIDLLLKQKGLQSVETTYDKYIYSWITKPMLYMALSKRVDRLPSKLSPELLVKQMRFDGIPAKVNELLRPLSELHVKYNRTDWTKWCKLVRKITDVDGCDKLLCGREFTILEDIAWAVICRVIPQKVPVILKEIHTHMNAPLPKNDELPDIPCSGSAVSARGRSHTAALGLATSGIPVRSASASLAGRGSRGHPYSGMLSTVCREDSRAGKDGPSTRGKPPYKSASSVSVSFDRGGSSVRTPPRGRGRPRGSRGRGRGARTQGTSSRLSDSEDDEAGLVDTAPVNDKAGTDISTQLVITIDSSDDESVGTATLLTAKVNIKQEKPSEDTQLSKTGEDLNMVPNSENIVANTENVFSNTGNVVANTENVVANTENVFSNTEHVVANTENVFSNTGNGNTGTGSGSLSEHEQKNKKNKLIAQSTIESEQVKQDLGKENEVRRRTTTNSTRSKGKDCKEVDKKPDNKRLTNDTLSRNHHREDTKGSHSRKSWEQNRADDKKDNNKTAESQQTKKLSTESNGKEGEKEHHNRNDKHGVKVQAHHNRNNKQGVDIPDQKRHDKQGVKVPEHQDRNDKQGVKVPERQSRNNNPSIRKNMSKFSGKEHSNDKNECPRDKNATTENTRDRTESARYRTERPDSDRRPKDQRHSKSNEKDLASGKLKANKTKTVQCSGIEGIHPTPANDVQANLGEIRGTASQSAMSFGLPANTFLGSFLNFVDELPDLEFKEGPANPLPTINTQVPSTTANGSSTRTAADTISAAECSTNHTHTQSELPAASANIERDQLTVKVECFEENACPKQTMEESLGDDCLMGVNTDCVGTDSEGDGEEHAAASTRHLGTKRGHGEEFADEPIVKHMVMAATEQVHPEADQECVHIIPDVKAEHAHCTRVNAIAVCEAAVEESVHTEVEAQVEEDVQVTYVHLGKKSSTSYSLFKDEPIDNAFSCTANTISTLSSSPLVDSSVPASSAGVMIENRPASAGDLTNACVTTGTYALEADDSPRSRSYKPRSQWQNNYVQSNNLCTSPSNEGAPSASIRTPIGALVASNEDNKSSTAVPIQAVSVSNSITVAQAVDVKVPVNRPAEPGSSPHLSKGPPEENGHRKTQTVSKKTIKNNKQQPNSKKNCPKQQSQRQPSDTFTSSRSASQLRSQYSQRLEQNATTGHMDPHARMYPSNAHVPKSQGIPLTYYNRVSQPQTLQTSGAPPAQPQYYNPAWGNDAWQHPGEQNAVNGFNPTMPRQYAHQQQPPVRQYLNQGLALPPQHRQNYATIQQPYNPAVLQNPGANPHPMQQLPQSVNHAVGTHEQTVAPQFNQFLSAHYGKLPGQYGVQGDDVPRPSCKYSNNVSNPAMFQGINQPLPKQMYRQQLNQQGYYGMMQQGSCQNSPHLSAAAAQQQFFRPRQLQSEPSMQYAAARQSMFPEPARLPSAPEQPTSIQVSPRQSKVNPKGTAAEKPHPQKGRDHREKSNSQQAPGLSSGSTSGNISGGRTPHFPLSYMSQLVCTIEPISPPLSPVSQELYPLPGLTPLSIAASCANPNPALQTPTSLSPEFGFGWSPVHATGAAATDCTRVNRTQQSEDWSENSGSARKRKVSSPFIGECTDGSSPAKLRAMASTPIRDTATRQSWNVPVISSPNATTLITPPGPMARSTPSSTSVSSWTSEASSNCTQYMQPDARKFVQHPASTPSRQLADQGGEKTLDVWSHDPPPASLVCLLDQWNLTASLAILEERQDLWTCKICQVTFIRWSDFEDHCHSHSSSSSLRCVCSVKFRKLEELVTHLLATCNNQSCIVVE